MQNDKKQLKAGNKNRVEWIEFYFDILQIGNRAE